jgi:hypothetical protein
VKHAVAVMGGTIVFWIGAAGVWSVLVWGALSLVSCASGNKGVDMTRKQRSERKSEASGGLLGVNFDMGDTGWLPLPAIGWLWWRGRREGRLAKNAVCRLVEKLEDGKKNNMSVDNVLGMVAVYDDDTAEWLHRRVKEVTTA